MDMKVNVLQDRRTRMLTEMRVDHFNKKILKGRQKNDEVKKDQFLKLLVTELKHQNPLDPMKDRDFIAQMAQLTSLEKMEKVREGMERLITNSSQTSLYSLMGKKVTYINEMGKKQVGAVDGIEFKNKEAFLMVNKETIRAKQILRVE